MLSSADKLLAKLDQPFNPELKVLDDRVKETATVIGNGPRRAKKAKLLNARAASYGRG